VTIGEGSRAETVVPRAAVTRDLLQFSRTPVRQGTPFQVVLQAEEYPAGPPVGEAFEIIREPVAVRYVAEWQTGILDELDQFRPDWVEVVDLPTKPQSGSPADAVLSELNARAARDAGVMPGSPKRQRTFVYESFHRDALLAADFGAAFNVSPLFRPMTARAEGRPDFPGFGALQIVLPNMQSLPWEAVVEFRSHAGSEEARERLREFDRRAAESEPEDAEQFLARAGHELNRELMAAWTDLQPSLPERLAEEAARTAVSLIPVAGPFAEKAATLAQILEETTTHRRSWIAALMQLQSRGYGGSQRRGR
jgi:hypothetical protein